jgi:hypothetical protein
VAYRLAERGEARRELILAFFEDVLAREKRVPTREAAREGREARAPRGRRLARRLHLAVMRWFLRGMNLPLPEQDVKVREVKERNVKPEVGDEVVLICRATVLHVNAEEVDLENFRVDHIEEVIRRR